MMATFYAFLSVILCLLNGGGNDLLDYLPSDAYWHEKQIDVSLERMLKELDAKPGQDVAKLINDLGSPDAETRDKAAVEIRKVGGAAAIKPLSEASDSPDAEVRRRAKTLLRQIGGDEIERGVRRLVAIRTLGEMRKPEALPKLKPLLESKELFVADYAHVAIDLIEGRRPTETRPVPANAADDVWLLPAECKTVGQLVPRRGSPPDAAEFAATLKADSAADPDAKKNDLGAELARMLVPLVEKIGNVRIDAVSFGISGTPGVAHGVRRGGPLANSSGYIAVVLRGRYHADWIRTLVRSEKVASEDVDGVEVFRPDNETAMIVPSDEVLAYITSENAVDAPAKALAATMKTGKPAARANDDATKKLAASIDANPVLWAVSAVTAPQKTLPVAEALDTITLLGTREGKVLNLKMTAKGSDAAQVKSAVDKINKHAKDSADFLEGMQVVSAIKLSVKLLRSMHADASGADVTMAAKLDTTPAAVLSMPFLTDEEGPAPEETPANPRLRK